MAGIINNTARQFNVKAVAPNNRRATVRLAPGLNDVLDDHWEHCVNDKFVIGLQEKGDIDFGEHIDNLVSKRGADTKSKSKLIELPKIKEDLGELSDADRIKAKAEMKAEMKAELMAEFKVELMAELKAEMKAEMKAEPETDDFDDDGFDNDLEDEPKPEKTKRTKKTKKTKTNKD